jgi:hypothetical protein
MPLNLQKCELNKLFLFIKLSGQTLHNIDKRCLVYNPCAFQVHMTSVIFGKQEHWWFDESSHVSRDFSPKGAEWVVREGVGAGGRNDPSLVCTYE